jgi:hypothetical protein
MPAPPLLTAGIYVIGTTLLFPGTILLLPTAPADAGTAAIAFLIAACSCLTVAALIDLHDAVTARAAVVPHLPMSTLTVSVTDHHTPVIAFASSKQISLVVSFSDCRSPTFTLSLHPM